MPERLKIRLAGGYYFRSLTRLIADLQPLLTLEEPAIIEIDLEDLTFMGPAALALTAATLFEIRERDLPVEGSIITAPRRVGMANYLHRMDFLRLVLDAPELPEPIARHETLGFRECRHFAKDEECRRVAKDLSDSLHEAVQIDATSRSALNACLVELAENVYYHAATPFGGYAAAQALSNEIEVAIVDLGVGVAESLAKNPDYAGRITDDLSAIKLAMKPTVTATPERNSGHGLAFTQLLLLLNQGRLMVRSGTGHLQIANKRIEKTEKYALPGTLVAMRLQLDRPLDFKRAWELLEVAIREIIEAARHRVPPTIIIDDDRKQAHAPAG